MSFVDTNILVYAAARGAPLHERARNALARLAVSEPLSISRQILREYIAVMTRPQIWGKPLTIDEATADAALILPLMPRFPVAPVSSARLWQAKVA